SSKNDKRNLTKQQREAGITKNWKRIGSRVGTLTGWCRSPRREVGNLQGVYWVGKLCQRSHRLVVPMAACQNGYVLHWAGRFVGFLLPMMAASSGYFEDGFWWHVTHALLGPLVPAQRPLAVLEVADWNFGIRWAGILPGVRSALLCR